MSYPEGLLKARGQIAFIAALVCSTAVIVYLEALDVEGRIQEQVIANFAVGGRLEPLTPGAWKGVETSIEAGYAAYEADASRTENRIAALNAAVLGISNALGEADQHKQVIETIMSSVEAEGASNSRALWPALALVGASLPEFRARVLELVADE